MLFHNWAEIPLLLSEMLASSLSCSAELFVVRNTSRKEGPSCLQADVAVTFWKYLSLIIDYRN